MNILFWGLILIVLSLLIQLVVWKIHFPKRQIKMLLCVFALVMTSGLFIVGAITDNLGVLAVRSFLEYFHICLLFISLTLAYMITYSAIEVDSPSLVMINKIAEAGSDGLDERLFMQMLNDQNLVKPRLDDLLNDKMAHYDGNKYRLTLKGMFLARLFIFYRKLLKSPKGG